MDLIHPHTKADVAEAMRAASETGTRVLIVGGRRHIDKGNPCDVDAELWTTQLDQVISYEPAEMVAVVEAGMRFGDLDRLLSKEGQEWPADAPEDATIGGIIAAAANSPRRLRVGPIRDSVLEVELVTGDGRLVRAGARVVKNVTGYDLPRLVTGSLGTLGVIVQVALKLRPRPRAARTLTLQIDAPFEAASRILDAVPLPTAVMVTPTSVSVRLEGWPEEIAAQIEAVEMIDGGFRTDDAAAFPAHAPWLDAPITIEAAVPPSELRDLAAAAGENWAALGGVGLLWAGLPNDDSALMRLRTRATELGGIAPAIRGPGGLGASPPAPQIHRRLKTSFDPANVLAPGRFWGETA